MALPELTAAVKVTKGGVEAANWLLRGLVQRRALGEDARRGRELLGIQDAELTYRIGALHPEFAPGAVHPDDEAALVSVAGAIVENARRSGSFKLVNSVPVSLEDGLVVIGSPETEAITRLAFGYSARMDGAGMTRWDEPPVRTPYAFQEDATVITAKSSRFVPGRGLQTRPNWPIVDMSSGSECLLFPSVGKLGLMQSDYLLITRMRNFLTRDAYQSGRSLVSIAGTHGPGTRAIGVLLHNKKALAQIARALKRRTDAFQILIHVSSIDHDEAFGSYGRSVEVCDVQTFSLTHAEWMNATATVQSQLDRWRLEISGTGLAIPTTARQGD